MNEFITYIEPTQPYLLLTFVLALVFLNYTKISNKLLLLILLICCINEITINIFMYLKKETLYISAVNLMLHNISWLSLIAFVCANRTIWMSAVVYMCYCIGSFFIFDGLPLFTMAFISGAILYLLVFIIESFRQLKKENFTFFTSNSYLLLSAPVLFFIGISFICGFSNKDLAEYKLFGEITLYQFITYFVNVVYYSIINYYIYSEKKGENA